MMAAWSRALLGSAAIFIAACRTLAPPAASLHRAEAPAMGSTLAITAYGSDAGTAQTAMAAAFAEVRRLEEAMTAWEHPGWPPSDIRRLNRAAGEGSVAISVDTLQVLRAAAAMAERSQGAFDVTCAPLAQIWKFDEDLEERVPTPAAIAENLALVNYHDLRLDVLGGKAALARPGMQVSLSGIAKGYAVDAAATVLRRAGLGNFFIQAGGLLYAAGDRGGMPWQGDVRDPRDAPDAAFAMAPLRDQAFSTAGDYERAFVQGGVRYHPILDPQTGQPARRCRSVTILAPTALLADGLDDAVFILGPERGMALLRAYPGVEALIVDADNTMWLTDGLRPRLRLLHDPTP